MLVANYIILAIIIIALGILYQKFCEKQSLIMPSDDFSEIRKYLLNESSLAKSKSPFCGFMCRTNTTHAIGSASDLAAPSK